MRERASTIMTLSQLKKRRKRRIKLVLAVLIIIGLTLGVFFIKNYLSHNHKQIGVARDGEKYNLVVSFLDVGQAHAAVITCDGEAMMIDSGLYESKTVVEDYLNDNKLTKLKYAVGTHPHGDHIGCMGAIIEDYKVDTLMIPDVTSEASCYKKMMEAAEKTETKVKIAEKGDRFTLGSAVGYVLYAGKNGEEDINNTSIIIRLEYENHSFLFMSDASSILEEKLLNYGFNSTLKPKADILLVSHHGSSDGSCEAFLKKVKPAEAVISCGKDNEYGHPHKAVLDRLNSLGIKVHRTDLEGTITYVVKSGEEIKLKGNRE